MAQQDTDPAVGTNIVDLPHEAQPFIEDADILPEVKTLNGLVLLFCLAIPLEI